MSCLQFWLIKIFFLDGIGFLLTNLKSYFYYLCQLNLIQGVKAKSVKIRKNYFINLAFRTNNSLKN